MSDKSLETFVTRERLTAVMKKVGLTQTPDGLSACQDTGLGMWTLTLGSVTQWVPHKASDEDIERALINFKVNLEICLKEAEAEVAQIRVALNRVKYREYCGCQHDRDGQPREDCPRCDGEGFYEKEGPAFGVEPS